MSLTQLVINWTIHQPGTTAALVGARNGEQASHNAQAAGYKVSAEELEQVRRAFDQTSKVMAG